MFFTIVSPTAEVNTVFSKQEPLCCCMVWDTNITYFIVLCKYCGFSSFFSSLQIQGLWQPLIGSISWHHFSNTICSFHVCVTLWWFSQHFKPFHFYYVYAHQWSLMSLPKLVLGLPRTMSIKDSKLNWQIFCVFWHLHQLAVPQCSPWASLFPETQQYWNQAN